MSRGRIWGHVGTGTLSTHLVFGRAGLWRAAVIIHGTWVRMRGRWHGRVAVRMRWVVGVLTGHRHPQWLSMRPVDGRRRTLRINGSAAALLRHGRRVSQVRVGSMRGHKGRGVRGDGGEDAFLLESLTVGTPSVFGSFEARAADLSTD